MNPKTRKSLISKNAIIWVGGILTSFILPMIAKSLTDGPGNFLQLLTHVGPLFIAMFLSTALLSKTTAAMVE